MAQESPKNSAAEIPVTSNGEVEDSHEHAYHRVRTLYFLLMQRIMTVLPIIWGCYKEYKVGCDFDLPRLSSRAMSFAI